MSFVSQFQNALRDNADALILWRDRLAKPAQLIVGTIIISFLAYKLQQVGWANVLHSLPRTPWFYLVFALSYFNLPMFEVIIYNWLWRTGIKSLPVFLRKRVYNEAVMEYSGEAMFYLWAKKQAHIPEQQVFRNIRDVNILSALSANILTLFILLAVVIEAAGILRVEDQAILVKGAVIIGALATVLVALAMTFRGRLIALPLNKCAGVAGLHISRLTVFLVLQALQWHLALPQISLHQWGLFLALQMGISRIPFLPTKDLIFAGVAISLGSQLAAPSAMVAGMFMACAGLNLSVHSSVYITSHLHHFFKRRQPASV